MPDKLTPMKRKRGDDLPTLDWVLITLSCAALILFFMWLFFLPH